MPKVNVEFGATTGAFTSGLARVKAAMDKFKEGASKGSSRAFSVTDMAKGAASALSARAVADAIIGAYRHMSELAGQVADRTARALNATVALTQVRNGPEARLAAGQKNAKFLRDRSQQARAEATEAADDPRAKYLHGVFDPMGNGAAARELAEKRDQIATDYEGQYQAQEQANAEIAFQLESQTRELKRQLEIEYDLVAVRHGRMSLEQAAKNELDRSTADEDRIAKDKRLGANALLAARVDTTQKGAGVKAAEVATIQSFKADSLARVGGGGGVYTGPADPVTGELKRQTEVLRAIANNTAKGGPLQFDFRFSK